MYKLTVRIRKAAEANVIPYALEELHALLISYCSVIRSKLNRVKSLQTENYLNMINHKEYVESRSFKNIERLCNEYLDKYARDLSLFWRTNNPEENNI